MAAEDSIRDLLPSLWRPEPDARGLLPDLIGVTGLELNLARIDGGNTMQAHWSRFADYAPISPFVGSFRRESGLPVLLPSDPEVEEHPYLDDLARLAGLLGLTPYSDPASARETVEEFRRRALETVALWRGGVSTHAAVLLATRLALSGTAERAVSVEEFAPAASRVLAAKTRAIPDGLVGPLMRWTVASDTLHPVQPGIYIEGAKPVGGKIDACVHPIIEHFDPATGTGVGILYDGEIAAGNALAIDPTYSNWLGSDTGVRVATSLPGATPANPTAPGPWAASGGAPTGSVTALVTAADGALWAAVEDAGDGQLWRLTTSGWSQIVSGLPRLNCLLKDGNTLLVGHANGLSRVTLFETPATLLPDPLTGTGPAINALARAADGTIWAATGTGAAQIDPGEVPRMVGPGARPETETPLSAVLADADGIVTFGGDLGLFRYDAKSAIWHLYRGESLDETVLDWQPWDPATDALPNMAEVFLPPVTALLRGPDTLLWLGTTDGLAAWGGFRIRNTYATRLRAFPALGTEPVHTLARDERGRIWAGTDRGLHVHDGFDWFEGNAGLTRLPRTTVEDPGSGWRFDRTGGVWQFAAATGNAGFVAQTSTVVTSDNAPVLAIHWTDGSTARLGSMAGDVFTEDTSASPAALRLRVKPTADRIVEGGLPAIPRLAPGTSHWRYLQEEDAAPPTPTAFPAWTREARLLMAPDTRPAPWEGRFLSKRDRALLDQVFAFNPAARVTFRWRPRAPLTITVRLDRPDPEETLPGAVLDRVFEASERVRPAGARLRLAFGETVVRGDQDG